MDENNNSISLPLEYKILRPNLIVGSLSFETFEGNNTTAIKSSVKNIGKGAYHKNKAKAAIYVNGEKVYSALLQKELAANTAAEITPLNYTPRSYGKYG